MSGLNDTDKTQLTKMLLYWRVRDLGLARLGEHFLYRGLGRWHFGIAVLSQDQPISYFQTVSNLPLKGSSSEDVLVVLRFD